MWIALTVVALAGVGIVVVGWMGLTGSLPRNGVAGVRTRFTRSSDAAWKATHRAAGPYLIFGGVAAIMVTLAFLPFTAAGKVSTGIAAAAVLVAALLLGATAIAGGLLGVRSAKRQLSAADGDQTL
ncbi:MAG TPA: SdpI family protein [Tepidiformaceae bacterium]|nr:SdpI family protein [Tepidiformaceae bacterium]